MLLPVTNLPDFTTPVSMYFPLPDSKPGKHVYDSLSSKPSLQRIDGAAHIANMNLFWFAKFLITL